MQKPTLACDIDEVIAYFIPRLTVFHNEEYGTDLHAESFCSYQFHDVWGGTVEDCNTKMELFYNSPHFIDGLAPVPAAFDHLEKLKEHFDLQVVTARQHKLEEITRAWVGKHYPGIFSEIHFGNHYSTEGVRRSKSEMCQSIGAVGLIDDSYSYAKECAQAGIPVVLFGDYAWNRIGDVSALNAEQELVHRAHSWSEAVDIVISKWL